MLGSFMAFLRGLPAVHENRRTPTPEAKSNIGHLVALPGSSEVTAGPSLILTFHDTGSVVMADMPESVKFGFVTGRILTAIGDRFSDPDRYPDAVPPDGARVTFTPTDPFTVQSGPGLAVVVKQAVSCNLDAQGYIVDEHDRGVWLVTGQYTVSIRNVTGFPGTFKINVTEDHTLESPLDLIALLPDGWKPAPVPHYQLLTAAEYAALPSRVEGTVYLIKREA